jgi:anti-sigma B factor antagonist
VTENPTASLIRPLADYHGWPPCPASGTVREASSSALRLSVDRPSDGTAVVTARGELDLLTAPRFADLLGGRLRGTLRLLIIDLSELDFLAAAGLSVLARARLRAVQHGIGLSVVTGQNHCVTRALTATGLDRELSLSLTIGAAERAHEDRGRRGVRV